jgi:hypothetical protein
MSVRMLLQETGNLVFLYVRDAGSAEEKNKFT